MKKMKKSEMMKEMIFDELRSRIFDMKSEDFEKIMTKPSYYNRSFSYMIDEFIKQRPTYVFDNFLDAVKEGYDCEELVDIMDTMNEFGSEILNRWVENDMKLYFIERNKPEAEQSEDFKETYGSFYMKDDDRLNKYKDFDEFFESDEYYDVIAEYEEGNYVYSDCMENTNLLTLYDLIEEVIERYELIVDVDSRKDVEKLYNSFNIKKRADKLNWLNAIGKVEQLKLNELV